MSSSLRCSIKCFTRRMAVSVPQADWPLQASVVATADTPQGRGDRGGLPLHLVLEARDVDIAPGRPMRWTIVLEPRAATAAAPPGTN